MYITSGTIFWLNAISIICLASAIIMIVYKALFKLHSRTVVGIVTYSDYKGTDEDGNDEYNTEIRYTFNGQEYKHYSSMRMHKGSRVELLVDCSKPYKVIRKSNSSVIGFLIVAVIFKIIAIIAR